MLPMNYVTCPVSAGTAENCRECGYRCADYSFHCRMIPHGAGLKNPAASKDRYVKRLRASVKRYEAMTAADILAEVLRAGFGSRNNRKVAALTINLPVLLSCDCTACPYSDGRCYAMNGRQAMQAGIDKRVREYFLYRRDPAAYERLVVREAEFDRVVRWFDSGDIVDAAFLDMMIRIADALPGTRFYAYTEKRALVHAYEDQNGAIVEKHPNLVIRFSDNGDPYNPYKHPISSAF